MPAWATLASDQFWRWEFRKSTDMDTAWVRNPQSPPDAATICSAALEWKLRNLPLSYCPIPLLKSVPAPSRDCINLWMPDARLRIHSLLPPHDSTPSPFCSWCNLWSSILKRIARPLTLNISLEFWFFRNHLRAKEQKPTLSLPFHALPNMSTWSVIPLLHPTSRVVGPPSLKEQSTSLNRPPQCPANLA